MKGIKGRFRTSELARTFYVGAILACMAVLCVMEAGRFMSSGPQSAPAGTEQKSLSTSAHGRRLMSSGVELIPGFTGGKCGSNWYVTGKDKNGNEKTMKIKKEDWNADDLKGKAYRAAGAEAYAQWEADSGGIIYVIASIYLFLGIAIICDAHFNDSLEMICSKFGLGLSADVAGATFMAAGSSAPELATSFLGVFVAKSAVGLGTIIGSAVFNILIIIGSVAILVTDPLNLDYRPVVRDNFFYAVSVVILCVCLAVDNEANLIDTIILLIWYALYILFMAFNQEIMDKVAPQTDDEVAGDEKPEEKKEETGAADTPMTPTMGDETASKVENAAEEPKPASEDPKADDKADAAPAEASKEGDTAKSDGGAGAGFGSGRGDAAPAEEEAAPKPAESDGAKDGSAGDVELHDVNVTVEKNAAADKPAEDAPAADAKDKAADDQDAKKKPKRTASFSTEKFSEGVPEKADENTHPCEGCCCWQSHQPEEEEEEDEPSQCAKITDQVLMVFAWPWEMLFKYTMPYCKFEESEEDEDEWDAVCESGDAVKKAELYAKQHAQLTCGQRWFWATFSLSLVHITWVSYFMVEFMLKIGCLWGIPDVVMGLTFLAMGTSIPDALGSLAVAKNGEGDMAVSNAVGSNVFDICMGLGLPWFIKLCIDSGKTCNYIFICNASADVLPSIFILLSIIVVLFSVFYVGKWKLYPQSGYVLFGVYGLFIVYQLLNTYVINKDPPTCIVPGESGYDECAV